MPPGALSIQTILQDSRPGGESSPSSRAKREGRERRKREKEEREGRESSPSYPGQTLPSGESRRGIVPTLPGLLLSNGPPECPRLNDMGARGNLMPLRKSDASRAIRDRLGRCSCWMLGKTGAERGGVMDTLKRY
jgi:hypothetical protein